MGYTKEFDLVKCFKVYRFLCWIVIVYRRILFYMLFCSRHVHKNTTKDKNIYFL